ncbi:hypothetical protein DB30_04545 [Enhygromyxa salina]|uniref:Uncharacterized protein n=1 Tax=Enhygromyxa salina TaxID=215803 RepID=A0A0C1ZYQ9_9BACT|nr:hypothetical protein [Enhygromyxa salina]KIG16378.1 hypothetical protein DB30_04545 [Enhygromyxa salina]
MPGLRILTVAPLVSERDGVLRARTSLLLQLLTLGAAVREVIVDRRSRYVIISQRVLWLFRRRRVIPFRMIKRITYDYDSTVTSAHRTMQGTLVGDEIERFDVGLVICAREDVPATHAHVHEEHVPLFSFRGEGSSRYFSFSADFEGAQEQLSRNYVERLRALIGVSFGNELEQVTDSGGRKWSCAGCGRPGPPRPGRCYYCGQELQAAK